MAAGTNASALRRVTALAGVDVRRRRNLPFGVRWEDDVAYFSPQIEVAIDVGANVGQTAERLLERFPGVQVHAFEPIPEHFAALVQATQGRDVVCVEAAVGDAVGRAEIALGDGEERGGFRAEGRRLEVAVTTLDQYAAARGIDRIGLLKVDTEGHEPAVLRGARGLLESGRVEHVLCECEFVERPEEPHGDFTEISRLLGGCGYRLVSFYTGGIDDLGWRWGDVLFRRVDTADPGSVSCSPNVERVRERSASSAVHVP